MQSATVKSYVSAIKKLLVDVGYDWDDQKVLLGSLTSACKLINDRVYTRLPIQCSLLEMILFEVQRVFTEKGQLYLEFLYKALFGLSNYGLMRVSEVTLSDHVLKAKDIHMGVNKEKLLIYLYSSQTHSRANKPQKISITSNLTEKTGSYAKRHLCPLELTKNYLQIRCATLGDTLSSEEQLFVFRDRSPVTSVNARHVLKRCLMNLGLDSSNYGMHSFRIGRTTDLIKYNYSL